MSGTLLPTPDDQALHHLLTAWPDEFTGYRHARSVWLGAIEDRLRVYYPAANSDSLTLTARSLAPFPLAKPGVP